MKAFTSTSLRRSYSQGPSIAQISHHQHHLRRFTFESQYTSEQREHKILAYPYVKPFWLSFQYFAAHLRTFGVI